VHRGKPTLLAITQQNRPQTICFLKQRVMILVIRLRKIIQLGIIIFSIGLINLIILS
jgi:hypothetical protein